MNTRTESHDFGDCEACKIIDAFDGKIDNQVFNLDHWKVPGKEQRFKNVRQIEDRFADSVTKFAGSLTFIYIHLFWFAVWIIDNLGAFGESQKFDRYPFGLLTMIVSLEAIFLSTIVMVSQNRQAHRTKIRSQVDFESNLQSLIWLVHIAKGIGIDIKHVQSLCDLAINESRLSAESETKPT